MGIGHTIEIACHNSVNIAKRETPKVTEECLAVGMFVRRININKLKGLLIELEFRRNDTAVRVRIMVNNLNCAPRVKE